MEEATTTRDDQPTVLPYDIIFEILSRLRVKTLCKFRCICKPWCDLISDPIFQEAHNKRSQENPLLLIISKCTIPRCKDLHFSSMDCKGTIVDEFTKTGLQPTDIALCQDLICLYDQLHPRGDYLLNPATEELISLPENPTYNCIHFFEIGYISSTKEYKVLRFSVDDPTVPKMRCEIFTLGREQRWRTVGDAPFCLINSHNAALIRGSLHFLPDFAIHLEFEGIAVFNMEREEWSLISPPAQFPTLARQTPVAMSKVGELLCLTRIENTSTQTVGLWLLKDYDKNVWVKEYTINIPLLYDDADIWNICPLAISDDGRVLMEVLECGLKYYDPKTRSFKDLKIVETTWFRTRFYVEGFTSLRVK